MLTHLVRYLSETTFHILQSINAILHLFQVSRSTSELEKEGDVVSVITLT